MAKVSKSEKDAAVERLREWVKNGDTVYCILRHRSASGMSRTIQLVTIDCSENIGRRLSHIGYNVAKATGYRYNEKQEGVVVGGCGFDAGHALVHDLASTLGIELRHEWI